MANPEFSSASTGEGWPTFNSTSLLVAGGQFLLTDFLMELPMNWSIM